MLAVSQRATLTAVITLGLALILPRLGVVNVVLLTPLWVTAALTWPVVYLILYVGSDKELGSSYALRPLGFTTPSAWAALLTRRTWESGPPPPVAPFNDQMDSLLDLVKTHYINTWYARISPSPAFPDHVEVLIRRMVIELVRRAGMVDWPTCMASRILPILTEHLKHFRSIEHLSSITPSIPLPLPKKPHPALAAHTWGSSESIEAHFRDKLDQIVDEMLHESDKSLVVSTLVREVLLGAVWDPVFQMLCDSDFWNRQIDDRAGRYLHEQKQVNKFLSALSEIPNAASPRKSRSITATSSTRQFEAFLRSIPKVRTLGEARHLRADIEREQRIAKSALDEAVELGNEARIKFARKYVKRLERARLEADHRITALHGSAATVPTPVTQPINLYAVMSEPATLAHWLEYMERRKRSRFVQFWLTVEGFKNPLEDISPTQLDTTHDDLVFLCEAYADFEVAARHLDAVRQDRSDSLAAGRQAMLTAQRAVYEAMEEDDWPDFKKTELFLKASTELSKLKPGVQSSAPPTQDPSTPRPAEGRRATSGPRMNVIRQQGSFTPVSAPSTQVSTVLPNFEGAMTDPRPPASRSLSSDNKSRSVTSSLPVTPPAPRRPSQLDFLIGHDDEEPRSKLFDDDMEEEFEQVERMEAIQAALNEIIASDDVGRKTAKGPEAESMSSSLVLPRVKVSPKLSSRSVEDLRSAEEPRRPSQEKTPLFDDIPDEETEDTVEDPGYDSPRPAAPGNLQLSVEIARLQDKITELVKQEHLLENLIRQAELVGNQHELRILQRSLSSVRREQRTTVFQKAQFEQQEEENRLLPGRTVVSIPSAVADQAKQVVRYSVEIKQTDEQGTVITGWMVARRYNEFWELDKDLRDASLPIAVEIPPKRLGTNMSPAFIETRRVSLEKYLQSLLSSAQVCESKILQTFLSRDTVPLLEAAPPQLAPQNIVRSLYRTMASSQAILGPSMLDVMYTSLSRQLSDISTLMGKSGEDLGALLPPALKQSLPTQFLGNENGTGSFTAPICDLFIEVFDLKESNWLRRQAIVVLLQQFFGGTIER